jgi:CheY-like chemotaxis protein
MADILVIDDDEMMFEIMSELLLDDSHSLRTATDGAAGLDEMTRALPDLVILDMNMPEMDGYSVARRIRESFPGDAPKILSVTGEEAWTRRPPSYRPGAMPCYESPSTETCCREQSGIC